MDEINLLQQAASEIRSLRHQNELMRARLDMFDAMTQLLHTQAAHQGAGYSPDLVYEIEKHIQNKKETTCQEPSI